MNDVLSSNESKKLEVLNTDFQLLKIVIIDSYCPGKKIELKLDGHVSINGRNGAGKTTLLRLIPIFFGELPSRVVFGSESFVKHYLPTTSSYIIYEYQRRDTKVMAVIHADGSKDQHVYRFVDHAYEDRLFIDDGRFVEAQDFHRHLDGLGILETKQLSRMHYKRILVNNASSEHRSFAARFAFCGGVNKLTHISRVVSGILNRITDFSDLKKMVISTVLGEDKQITLSTKRDDLTKWIKELQAHQAISLKEPLMASLEQSDARREESAKNISVLHGKFHALSLHLDDESSRVAHLIADKKQSHKSSNEQYLVKNRADQEGRTGIEANYKQKLSDIHNLENRFKKYEQGGINQSNALVQSIPSLEQKVNTLKSEKEALTGEITSVEETFNAQKFSEKLTFEKNKGLLNESKRVIEDGFRNEETNLTSNYQSMTNKLSDAGQQIVQALRIDETAANDRVVTLKALATKVSGDESIRNSLNEARENAQRSNESLIKAGNDRLSNEKLYAQHNTEFVNQERVLEDVSSALEVAEGELSRIVDFYQAGEDTLIGFLRTQRPEWVGDIGLVINDELLLRKDLKPEIIADVGNLYGLSINLQPISPSKMLNEDSLQVEITRAKGRVVKFTADKDEEESRLLVVSKKRQAAETQQTHGEIEFNRCENLDKEAAIHVTSLSLKLERSKNEERASIESELSTASGTLHKIKTSIQLETENLASEIAAKKNECKVALQALCKTKNKAIEEIDANIVVLQNSLDIKIASIEENRLDVLKGKGINPEHLISIESAIKGLSNQIEEAKHLIGVVTEYSHWLESTYSWLGAMRIEANNLKISLDSANRDLDARKKAQDDFDALIKSELQVLEKEQSEIDLHISSAKQHLADLYQFPRDVSAVNHENLTTIIDLINDKNSLLAIHRKELEFIASGVHDIRQVMMKTPHTAVYDYCVATEKEDGTPSVNLEYRWLGVCRGWFNVACKGNKDAILQSGRSHGLGVKAFCDALEDVQSKVAIFNRELRSALGKASMFAKIESVDVDIVTDLNKHDYWTVIQTLKTEYENWHPLSGNSMPPESFMLAANAFSEKVTGDRGLVATPTDLITIKVEAVIHGKKVSASEERELSRLSSNGLSYLILTIVMIAFVERIRRDGRVTIPYAVDEVKDLDYANTSALLEFLTANNINIIGAFPDIDERLAPKFKHKYNVMDDKRIALIDIESEIDMEMALYV